jgi:hypothetical protein
VLKTFEQTTANAFVDFVEAGRTQPPSHLSSKTPTPRLVGVRRQHRAVLTVLERFGNREPIGQTFLKAAPRLLSASHRVWVDLGQPNVFNLIVVSKSIRRHGAQLFSGGSGKNRRAWFQGRRIVPLGSIRRFAFAVLQ